MCRPLGALRGHVNERLQMSLSHRVLHTALISHLSIVLRSKHSN